MYNHPTEPHTRDYSKWCQFPEMRSSPNLLQDELKRYGSSSSTGIVAAGIRYDDINDIHKIDDYNYITILQYDYFILDGKILSGRILTKLNMRRTVIDKLYYRPLLWHNSNRDLKKLLSEDSWYVHGCLSSNDDGLYTLDVELIVSYFWPTASDDNGGITAMYGELYI